MPDAGPTDAEGRKRIPMGDFADHEATLAILRAGFYEFREGKFEGLYRNNGDYACAIVASVGGIDWAAYIGGCSPKSEEEGLIEVAKYGAKLSEREARFFFGDLPLMYRE